MSKTVRLTNEAGEVIRDVVFRPLMPGKASRHARLFDRLVGPAKVEGEKLDELAAAGKIDPDDFDEQLERLLDKTLGAACVLLAAVVEGLKLPAGEVPWQQGYKLAETLILKEGWTSAEIDALALAARQHVHDVAFRGGTAVMATADFSDPPADSPPDC
jgi:hypothetical protein